MKFLHLLIGVLVAAFVATAFARGAVPVVNYDNVAFTTGTGKKPASADVQRAIVRAANQLQWAVTSVDDNTMVASINVRGKHTVTVDISWTAETYSIRYKSSVNMNFSEQPAPVIHPSYNKWIDNLRVGIQKELSQL